MVPFGVDLDVVGAQGGLDQGQVGAQDPVVGEADHLVQRTVQLVRAWAERRGVTPVTLGTPGMTARSKESPGQRTGLRQTPTRSGRCAVS